MGTLSNSKQTFWLGHIEQAKAQKLSLAAYAKQHNLSDKSLYRWKTVLTQRGLLVQDKAKVSFAKVKQVTSKAMPEMAVDISLANGHRLQLASANQATLIALLNALRND